MIWWIANVLIIFSAGLDVYAVYRQITKTLTCGDSSDVSTAFFSLKISKDIIGAIALFIYANWAGLCMLVPVFFSYIIAYIIIIRHKPREWKPNAIEAHIRRITK